MKHTRKILVALIVVMTLMITLAAAIIPASAATTKTYYLDASVWDKDGAKFVGYFWVDGGASKFVEMVDSDGDGIYECTVDASFKKVIFLRKSKATLDWNNEWNRVGDITIPTNGNNRCIITGWEQSSYKWDKFTPTACKKDYDAYGKCSNTNCTTCCYYTVAGSGAHLGTEWDSANKANDMTYDATTGTYTKVFTNVAKGSYELKCAKNHDWAVAHPAANKAYTVKHDGSTVTVTLKGETVNIVVNEGACYGGSATCTAKAKCEACGNEYGTALGHADKNADHVCDNGCLVAQGTHAENDSHSCTYCGNADASWVCRGGSATCTAKAKCEVCGNEYGDTLDHTYVDGKCQCGAEDPNYVPPHVHNYNPVITAPTFDSQGYTTHTCSCGDYYVDSYVDALVAVAMNGDNKYESIQAAVNAATAGDTIVVIANISNEAVTVDKNLVITGASVARSAITLTNVSINANGADTLTVSGLNFEGNSWINSGSATELVVSGVNANVNPSNSAYTNSRSAFISLGRSEGQSLDLTVENCNIVCVSGTNPVLGWAAITEANISGNTFGSASVYQNNGDSVKFMSIADGAVLNFTNNTTYSNYNGIVLAQNTTRGNSYTVTFDGNTFVGGADHIWIELSTPSAYHGNVNVKSNNTINGNAVTVSDIKTHNASSTTGYAGIDVVLDSEGKVIGGNMKFASEGTVADGYELDANGNVVVAAPTLSGSGTEADPFVISSLDELKIFRDMVNAGTTFDNQFVVLTADIDLNNEAWTPIGSSSAKFLGCFDGNNNTISNLYVSINGNNAGLFGFAYAIKNVRIHNAKVSGLVCVGALVGELETSVSIVDNCHVTGNIQITGENSVGGLAGKGYTSIKNSSVIGDGAGTSFVLGVYGSTEEGDNVGGIIGHLSEGNTLGVFNSTVKNIKVIGTRKVGGIVGTTGRENDIIGNSVDGIVIECTATAEYANSNASTTTIGGIVGNYFGSAASGGILQDSSVSNVEFVLGNAKSAGTLVGGDRVNNGGAPVGVEASGSTVSNVTGATNEHLLPVYVAQVGENKYLTLEEAFAAAQDGNTVTLLVDVSISKTVQITKAITIDGNGHKISLESGFVADGHGAVIVFAGNSTAYKNIDFAIKNLTFEGFSGLTRVVRANFANILIENCKFINNNVSDSIISSAYAALSIDGCEFTNNTCGWSVLNIGFDVNNGTELVANITNSSFVGNKGSIAIAYLASSANVTGNYWSGNVHTGTNPNGAAILAGPYTGSVAYTINVTDNAFVNAISNGTSALPAVFVEDWSDTYNSTTAFDLSSNYWDGQHPAVGVAYQTSGSNPDLVLDDYFTAYENGALGGLEEISFVAQIGDSKYESLAEAVANAQNNDTIIIIGDIVVTSTVTIPADLTVTLDLNGKTIDGTGNVRIAIASYGVFTLKDSSAEQTGIIKAGIGTGGNTVNICGGTFTMESGSIYSLNNAILVDENASTVNIYGGKITAEPTTNNSAVFYVSGNNDNVINIYGGEMVGYNGLLLWNNNTVNITGGTITAAGRLGIQTNGSKDNTEINISGGEITAASAAIYHPCGGVLNISGGTLTGATGIVVKGGKVTISGGTINGIGAAADYKPVSSGFADTGDALYVEHYDNSASSDNYGTPVVIVTGGSFISTNGQAVASYKNTNNTVEALDSFITGGTFNTPVADDLCADGFECKQNADGSYGVQLAPVVKIGDNVFYTLEDALAAAQAGDEIILLADVNGDITVPADVIFNGNGFAVSGTLTADGNITFAGITKVGLYSIKYSGTTTTIGSGASLQLTGTGRIVVGHGCKFVIEGNLADAKTANKADVVPSFVVPGGVSITGNGVSFSVKNAYVSFGNTSSKNNSANQTFDISFENSIAEFTNQFTLSAPTSDKNPTFNINIKDSVFTTGTKLCIAAPNSNVVIDNSTVTLGNYLRNSGTLTLVNGSVLTGKTIQFGENGGNDGTIIVDGSTFTISCGGSTSHAFDGNNTGKIQVINGGSASVEYVTESNLYIDATSTFASKSADLAISTDAGYAIKYENGVYYTIKVVAKIGNAYYQTFAEAYAAAQAGDEIVLLDDVLLTGKLVIAKAITIDGQGHSIKADETATWYTVSGSLNIKNYKTHLIGVNSDNVTLKNVTLDCNNNAAGINIYCAQNVVFENVEIINATKGFAALTVNGSTLTVKGKFTALGNAIAVDASNGSGVTSALGFAVEDGTVLDLGDKTFKFTSVATIDVSGAVNAAGEPYFAAIDNAYLYTETQIASRTTGFSNGLKLLADLELNNDLKIKGNLDLNGHSISFADGKGINATGKLAIVGEGNIGGAFVITSASYTITGPQGLDVTTTLEGYMVAYADGVYSAVKVIAKIGDTNYASLEAAIKAAQDGATIVLSSDAELSATTNINKSITIDGNGHKLTQSDSFAANGSNAMLDLMGGATVTFKNLTFEGIKNVAIMRTVSANIVMDSCTVQNCEHTVSQGLLRLACGNATITNSKFLNNNCTMVLSFGYDAANDTDVLTIDGCTFEGNSCGETAVVYFADGDAAKVTNTKFIDNSVSSAGNAATLYMGWGDGFEISGCLFDGNTVTTSHATTKRFASAIFADGCKIENNIFLENTAIRNGETIDTMVAVGAYYGKASVSANYWNGGKPAYTVEYTNNDVELLNYYTSYDPETGAFGEEEKTTVKAGKYYYTSIEEAIAAAGAEDVIVLLEDVTVDALVLNKSVTIDGAGYTITAAIKIGAIARRSASDIIINITNANIVGVEGEAAVISILSNADLTITNSTIKAVGDNQYILLADGVSSASAYIDAELTLVNGEVLSADADDISCSFRADYSDELAARGYVVKTAENNMVKVSGSVPYYIGADGYWYFNGEKTEYKAVATDGATPSIGSNGNWFIGDIDTGVKAEAINGSTPVIGENGNWWIDGEDTGKPAIGVNGVSPTIGENGNWFIGDVDTGIPAKGQNGQNGTNGTDGKTPHIGSNGNWFIGDVDTCIAATGSNGKTPYIGDNGNWWIDNEDTGKVAIGKDGADGKTPHIGDNGNWFIGDVDTGISSKGEDGKTPSFKIEDGYLYYSFDNGQTWTKIDYNLNGSDGNDGVDGKTPYIGDNGNWWIGTEDTGVKAEAVDGEDGKTPYIGSNGNWWIGETDTGIKAAGTNGIDGLTPFIGENGNWWIGNVDTKVPAIAKDGKTPHIGENGNWWIGENDTGKQAIAKDGKTPHIGENGNWWIGETDTGVLARGQDGKTPAFKIEEGHLFVSFGDDVWEDLGKISGDDGLTPYIGENGNWWIGETDTGVKANGSDGAAGATPYIGENGNWWIGETDTGIQARGVDGNDNNQIILICIGIATLCLITTIVAVATRKQRRPWWILT